MKDYRKYNRIDISEQRVTCKICRGTKFLGGDAQLNTRGLTLLGLDWLNKSAQIFICSQCGFIQWFLRSEYETEKIEDIPYNIDEYTSELNGPVESIECLNCGNMLKENETACSKCKWSYK